jgi:hypothetical protein
MTTPPLPPHDPQHLDQQRQADDARVRRRPVKVVCSPATGCQLVAVEAADDDADDFAF